MNDTIFALASGRPPAAIALIRISGADAFAAGEALARNLPSPRRAGVRTLRDVDGTLLDTALILSFPNPTSATGEDIVELHLHGGRAVVDAVLAALSRLPGLRPAQPGEFTRRALANGRIDLGEAEGLADLLAAETEQQRRIAIQAAGGAVSRALTVWEEKCLALAARIEASIDFSDEADVPSAGLVDAVVAEMELLAGEMAAVLARPPTDRVRDGVRVVLAGPPNAGKSTLLNALSDRDAAIVSPIAGTTRDRLEIPVARRGVAYVLTDTAGLAAQTDDPIEQIGIERAQEAMHAADIVLWLGDDPAPELAPTAVVALHPRADAAGRERVPPARLPVVAHDPISVQRLWGKLEACADALLPTADRLALNRRQREFVEEALERLLPIDDDVLLIAESLRLAHRALSQALGRQAPEAMLDALFARFCIGK